MFPDDTGKSVRGGRSAEDPFGGGGGGGGGGWMGGGGEDSAGTPDGATVQVGLVLPGVCGEVIKSEAAVGSGEGASEDDWLLSMST